MDQDTRTSGEAGALLVRPKTVLERVQHTLHRYSVISPLVVLIVTFVVFALLGHGRFQRPSTIGINLQQAAVMATLAIGQTIVILTAGIDLSIGTAMILVQLVVAKLTAEQGLPGPLALVIGALVGFLMGAFHGGLITRIGLPPFIVTLGSYYIYNSIGLVYSKGQTISSADMGGDHSFLLWTGRQIKFGTFAITTGVVMAVLMYAVFAFVLAKTSWGRHVYATGDDKEAARLAGINVNRVLISVYMVAGLIYALGAWVQIGRAGSASPNAATDVNLETITAVVIGGTSLFGGRGRISGTLIGALIVYAFKLGLSVAGVNAYYQNLAIGVMIIVAVALDQWIRRLAK